MYRDFAVTRCLDPLTQPTIAEGVVVQASFDQLISLNAHGKVYPMLAASWKYSHGGKWVTFYLRHDIRYFNGRRVDANAVKYMLDRALGPLGQSAGMTALLGPLQKVVVNNKYTVTLILRQPFGPIMPNLWNSSFAVVDPRAFKKMGETQFCRYPVGTGPFYIKNVASGASSVTLLRNPYYRWAPPWFSNHNLPYLSKIIFKPIVSDSTAVSELLSGGVDISQIAGSQYSRVEHNPNIVLYKALAAGVTFLDFKANAVPWKDEAVRRAIAQAINRQGIINAALDGLAKPAYSPVPQNVPYYDPASPNYLPKYDPSAAQKVLAARHIKGPYTLLTDNTPTDTTAAELIQAELSSVGVNVKIVTKASSDYISAAQKGQFDLLITSFFSPDADSFMYLLFHSSQEVSGGLNFTFYKNPTLDKLILEGRTTIAPEKETKIYAQAQRIILHNVVCDPLWTPENVYGMRPYVHGFHTDILGLWPNFQDLYVTKK